tara:strand:+ start:116 stop:244 length:129 start_codon:yes stop_codon:yes gene_type:complete
MNDYQRKLFEKLREEHANYKFLFRILFGYLIFDVLLHLGAFA